MSTEEENMEIRAAMQSDVDAMNAVYEKLFDYEEEHGTTTQWQRGLYPTVDVARDAYERGWLFVCEDEGEVIGGMIVNNSQEPVYSEADWKFEAEGDKVFVLHTMCVAPERSGRGIASSMVLYAEDMARERGGLVLRIDTWEGNRPAASLYTKLGYRYAGRAFTTFKDVFPEYLIFFEKELTH